MSYVLSEQARDELTAAFDWYLINASAKVAEGLLAEFERAARLIDALAGLGTPAMGGRKVFPLRRYPYSLVYRAGADGVRIGAVAHHRRKPRYWRDRT